MSVSNRNSGIHVGVIASTRKMCDEKKEERKKRLLHKIFFNGRKDFVWLYQKSNRKININVISVHYLATTLLW